MWGTRIKPLPFKLVVQDTVEIWRAADFWTKEPETIAWIDSFEPNSVFWDIGANVGVFSIYAMTKCKAVFPFEPEKLNFNRLAENVTLNNTYIAFANYAVSDFDGKSTFHVPVVGAGRSGGQLDQPIDEIGQGFEPEESYEVETYKIDTLAAKFGVPNYIKIDIDGQEWRVLHGGNETLKSHDVRGVLVEVTQKHDLIENFMLEHGFSSFNRFNGADINRRANEKAKNIIYLRNNT